jgi:thioredoxin reductase
MNIYDVVIVGAGSAGLSAALALGRARRKVLLLNGGEPLIETPIQHLELQQSEQHQ